MEDAPKVAVIVLNWNGFDDTVECLESLKKATYENYRIVLVDNGSDNDEGERLKELFPHIHLIRNEENRGFAGANNDGINWAFENGFDYIVNLNNDCIVEEDWLSNLVSGLRAADADFGSSRIMFYPETLLICSDGDVIWPDAAGIPENWKKTYSAPGGTRQIFSACGAGSIYSSKCLRAVQVKENQFFDELYFAYYEDLDLGIRLNSKSYKGVSVPDAVVYHKHSQTAGEYSRFKVFQVEKNRILNEILNYPLYLLPLGELFFALRASLFLIYSILNKKSRGYGYVENVGIIDMIILSVRARFWIISHLSSILKNRQERKARGYINRNIIKRFCWNPARNSTVNVQYKKQ